MLGLCFAFPTLIFLTLLQTGYGEKPVRAGDCVLFVSVSPRQTVTEDGHGDTLNL